MDAILTSHCECKKMLWGRRWVNSLSSGEGDGRGVGPDANKSNRQPSVITASRDVNFPSSWEHLALRVQSIQQSWYVPCVSSVCWWITDHCSSLNPSDPIFSELYLVDEVSQTTRANRRLDAAGHPSPPPSQSPTSLHRPPSVIMFLKSKPSPLLNWFLTREAPNARCEAPRQPD